MKKIILIMSLFLLILPFASANLLENIFDDITLSDLLGGVQKSSRLESCERKVGTGDVHSCRKATSALAKCLNRLTSLDIQEGDYVGWKLQGKLGEREAAQRMCFKSFGFIEPDIPDYTPPEDRFTCLDNDPDRRPPNCDFVGIPENPELVQSDKPIIVVNGNRVMGIAHLRNDGFDMQENYLIEMQVQPRLLGPMSFVSSQSVCDLSHPENVHKRFKLASGESAKIDLTTTVKDGSYDVFFITVNRCSNEGGNFGVDPYQYGKYLTTIKVGDDGGSGSIGSACAFDYQCSSLNCQGFTCREKTDEQLQQENLLPLGRTCINNGQCQSQNCEGFIIGTCTEPKSIDERVNRTFLSTGSLIVILLIIYFILAMKFPILRFRMF